MNAFLNKHIAVFAAGVLALLLAVPTGALAQNNSKGPGGGPPDPGGLVQTVTINVPMPVERLNQQYTSDFIYTLPNSGGTVTFAAYCDPVNPDLGITDVEALNGYLAGIQADTLMTFTSASTNTGQMWWDFTLQILPNDNTFSTDDQTKAARRQILLTFPLSTGNILQITVSQAEGADRLEVFPEWPDESIPIAEPLIDHTPPSGQDSEVLTNWIRKATYIGSDPYTPNDSIVDKVFYNGLGQPKQTVQIGASANSSKNIVTLVEYDPMGEMLRQFLPYVSTSASETYETSLATKQAGQYHTLYGVSENHPYQETVPEAATGRALMQYTQGSVFRDSSKTLAYQQTGIQRPRTDAQGRFLSNAYRLNTESDRIPILTVENGNLIRGGYYQPGTLFKTITTDPDGKTVATFTDEFEKTHLVRTYLGGYSDTTENAGWSDLVYVYDSRDLLSAVITPEGEYERNKTAQSISLDSDWAKKRCYIYKYDGLGRMTERRWPGKGKELFVTDPAGNVVAAQDSLLRQSGRWRLTRYDRANRPVETLLTQQSISESQMRDYFNYSAYQTYFTQGGNAPYYPAVYSLSDNISLTKTEIGKAAFSFNIPDIASGNNSQSITLSFKVEGQTASITDVDTSKTSTILWERTAMTMSKDGSLIGIAEDANSYPATVSQADILYRYTAYFYDRYGRPLQTVTLYPDGSVLTASTEYRYEDLPQRQVARLSVPQGNCLANNPSINSTDTLNAVLTETFTYDKRGRMLTSNATLETFTSFIQNNTLTYSDTLSSSASAVYSYDNLGRLTGKTLGGNLSQTLAYNIQDWLTTMKTKKGTANIFSQTLRYYSPAKPNTTALYSGNISEWETVQGTNTASTYGFTYDTQGRLTSSDRYNGTSTAATQLYTERNISYDRNGNILTLKRISNFIPNPLHNFTYSYDGDKLSSLTRWEGDVAMNTPYSYDGNGNMTFDGDQQMKLCYDINNLLHDVKKVINTQSSEQEDLTAVYSYFADGTKYSIKDTDGNSRIYIGPFTLARKEYTDATTGDVSAITILESADAIGSDARFAFAATPQTIINTDTTYTIAYETLYLIKDHLGSVRTITDSQGNALERNDYYPYGLQTNLGRNYPALAEKYSVRMPASFSDFSQNGNAYPTISSPAGKMLPFRLLYNGKELQLIAQTRLIDYGARQYDPTIARWNGMDPMGGKNQFISTYSYCNNNPIYLLDIAGKEPCKRLAGTIGRFVKGLNNTRTKMGTLKGNAAEDAMYRLAQVGFRKKGFGPLTTGPFNIMKGRYVYTRKGGWIDMSHFMFYAGVAYTLKKQKEKAEQKSEKIQYPLVLNIINTIESNLDPVISATTLGYLQESIFDPCKNPESSYSYEDLPSDYLGAVFGAFYFDPNSSLSLGDQLMDFFYMVLDATTPFKAPNYNSLPESSDETSDSEPNKTIIPQHQLPEES
ncbi:MAG: hypothetical protein E7108_03310 [Bacteroidales bacterium]|jgi:RHS repeat-associated protein|nr:hypothetical protein [Bacteroidales bacterium]